MARAPSTFRQQDVTKALKAASAAGLRVTLQDRSTDGQD